MVAHEAGRAAFRGDPGPAAASRTPRGASGPIRPAARSRCCWQGTSGSGIRWRSPSSSPNGIRSCGRRIPRRAPSRARSCAEMHSGFAALRTFLPMDFTARFGPPGKLLEPGRRRHRAGARDLGRMSRAALPAPGRSCSAHSPSPTRCSRPSARASPPTPSRSIRQSRAYVAYMMALPAMQEWGRGATAEVAAAPPRRRRLRKSSGTTSRPRHRRRSRSRCPRSRSSRRQHRRRSRRRVRCLCRWRRRRCDR